MEKEAIHAIDDAIAEIKRASIDDGKDLNDHPPVDARLDHTGRLHRARQLLDSARQDISHEEDNGLAQGLQLRALPISTKRFMRLMGLSTLSKLAPSQEQNLMWRRGVHGCGAIFFDLSRDV